jgi:amino acid adenylation domain-containing protein
VALQGYAHQDIPFEQLVEELNPQRSLSHSPLFQVMFALQNMPREGMELQGVRIEPVRYEEKEGEGVSRFDLTLSLSETESGLLGGLEYNTDLFDRGTVRRLLEHYGRLLSAIIAAPNEPVLGYELLSQEERQRQLIEWNATEAEYPSNKCIHELFEEQVRCTPDAVAVVHEDQLLTYGELNARANRLASYLIAQGVQPDRRVGLCVDRSVEMVVGMLGILKAGGAYVPLDPAYPAERLGYLIKDSGVELIVTQPLVWSRLDLSSCGVEPEGIRCVPVEAGGTQQRYSSADPGARVRVSNLACVVYHADLLGIPTGVMIAHSGVLNGSIGRGGRVTEGIMPSLLAGAAGLLSGEGVDLDESMERSEESAGGTHLVLGRNRELLPLGAVGELYVRGEAEGWGYLNRAGLTAERFVPDPYSEVGGERLYRTGEQAHWMADGALKHVSRKDESGESRGKREALAVERALLGHEEVREAVVVELDGPPAHRALMAYVVKRTAGAEPTKQFIAQLKGYLRAQRTFCAVPQEWMVLESLPRTATGGLDRSGLSRPEGVSTGHEYVAPRTELQRVLAEVWQERLGTERIGVEDNYFALGGDSIRSVSLVVEAQRRGLNFSVKDLFAHPTVSELASAMERGEVQGGVEAGEEITPFGLLTEREREQLKLRHDMESVEDAYPLSMMQQGMMLESLRHPGLAVYQNFHLYQFSDAWDLELFERALRHLMGKHPMLRSVFDLSGERPLQLVLKDVVPEFETVDLRSLDKAEVRAALDRWMRRQRSEPLEMSSSLWRLAVHLLSDQGFIFAMFLHHALWDGWSLESFATELYATYGMLKREGRVAESRPLPSYKQFIALEQAAVSSEEHRKYWGYKLDGASVPWWTGKEKSVSASIRCEISRGTSRAFAELARSLGLQEKSVWCSVYLALLSLLAGVDGVVGTVITQGRPEVIGGEKIIGVFLNALPIRVRMSGRRWVDLITETDRELREQHAFRRYPLAEIQRLTGLDYSGAMFNYANWHVYYEGVDGEETHEKCVPRKVGGGQETNYLLSVDVQKDDKTGRCHLSVTADTRVFDEDFRDRIQEYVAKIVRAIETDVAGVIDKASLLGNVELHRQLTEWNATEVEYPSSKCIHELFEDQVQRTPDAVAVVCDGRQLTYEELNARANRLAHCLIERGVRPDMSVGICVERGPEMVVALLGVLKAGGCYVPLDPSYPASRLEYLLMDSGASLVVTSTGMSGEWMRAGVSRVYVEEARGASRLRGDPRVSMSGQNLAYVIYTSGSTGQPKGVRVTHGSVTNFSSSMQHAPGISAQDRLLAVTTLSFDIALVELGVPLIVGGVVIVAARETAMDGEGIEELMRDWRVTILQATPARWRLLLDGGWTGNRELKALIGGESFSQQLSSELVPRVKQLWNLYGPTETTVWSMLHRISSTDESVYIGKPIGNTHAYVLDRDGRISPVGVAGELCIGGLGLSQGYLHRGGSTAEKFVPSPFGRAEGQILYRTGDLVRWKVDGNLEFLGRADHQVKVRGHRIELGEIEAQMLSHQRVREAVVLAREEEAGEKSLVAYYADRASDEADASEELGAQALRKYLAARLPQYMVPAAYVHLEAFPLTPNGKVDRQALPAPEGEAYGRGEYEAPQGEVEETLAELWGRLLRIERVGRQDNFFDLGGHSLLAMAMANKLEELGHIAPIASIFKYPQLEQLAQYLSQQRANIKRKDNAIVFQPEGSGTPLFLIHEVTGNVTCLLSLAQKLDPGFPIYGIELKDAGHASSVESLAAYHVKTMRAIQPHGPYRLAGYSFGGLVAHEIADQLLGENENVSFLGLIDTYTPGAASRLAHITRRRLRALRATPPRAARGIWRIAEACIASAAQYRLRPIGIPVFLFEAADNVSEETGEPSSMGWESLSVCDLRKQSIPGSHESILIDPLVDTLARKMSAALRQCGNPAIAPRK